MLKLLVVPFLCCFVLYYVFLHLKLWTSTERCQDAAVINRGTLKQDMTRLEAMRRGEGGIVTMICLAEQSQGGMRVWRIQRYAMMATLN